MAATFDAFYAPPSQINNNIVSLAEKEAHHIINVLRKKPGDNITTIDGIGNTYNCEIIKTEQNSVQAQIINRSVVNNEPETALTLAVALPKKNKFELIVEKCTELGVKSFIPLATERTQVKAKSLNHARCKKIAISAMKQSKRSFLPDIQRHLNLRELVQRKDFDLKIVAHEKTEDTSLMKTLLHTKTPRKSILAIGPEGGFSEEEVSYLQKNNYIPVSLGKTRLRTETAAIVGSAIILNYCKHK